MTGRTGYTSLDNTMPPDGPAQMNGIYEHFDALVGESFPDAGSLPSTGNWPGRTARVQADRSFRAWNGSGWDVLVMPEQSYTPSLDRVTVGNGSLTSTWTRVGRHVHVEGSLICGSTTAFAAVSGVATIAVSLPINAASKYGVAATNYEGGRATFLDQGIEFYFGRVIFEAAVDSVKIYGETVLALGGPVLRRAVNSSAPFGWGAGDVLSWSIDYLAA